MKNKVSKLCSLTGTLIISLIILLCIPMALPSLFGFQVYNIISGSMEPALPIGSAIYVEQVKPLEIQVDDVVAFWVEEEVVAHRVIKNEQSECKIYTKGDANIAEDRNPIAYENIIGTVNFHIPYVGNVLYIFSTKMGKVYLLCLLIAALLLKLAAAGNKPNNEANKKKMSQKEKLYRGIVFSGITIFFVLLIVIGIILKNVHRYATEKNVDEYASSTYTAKQTTGEKIKFDPDHCPITVDFEELKEINPEIVAWIYCEDSVIDYPVCRTEDDEYYLSHSYDKKPKASGSIFLETKNAEDCSDSNLILYGHHMKNKTMFATLSDWSEQRYYETHPFMWLLTPEKTYRIDLFAGYITDALSDTYTVFQGYAPELAPYLKSAKVKSDFQANIPHFDEMIKNDELEDKKFIVLSTCEYSFQNARYVLHGELVDIDN